MRCLIIINVLALYLCQAHLVAAQGCFFKTDNLEVKLPLLLYPRRGFDQIESFVLPNCNKVIQMNHGDIMHVECPGGFLIIGTTLQRQTSGDVQCDSGTTFKFNNRKIDIRQLSCSVRPRPTAFYTGSRCAGNYREATIGFQLNDGSYVRHINLCFDDVGERVFYATHYLTHKICDYQIVNRVPFVDNNFFRINISAALTKVQQKITVNNLVGLPSNSEYYIKSKSGYYLASGHLAPKADFFYGSQQWLTFNYINSAPQWQTLNEANWKSMEKSVRDFSSNRKKDLFIITGTHGITTLPHQLTRQNVNLYLYVDRNENLLPIPELFWKIVYEPISQKGVVFISINNPYKQTKPFICNNVCNRINWIHWKENDQKKGYSYCCEVPDFRATVNTFPNIIIRGLLT